ncbi:MAG: L,D-transpeptidase family protein [Patescibacteria group bacterium]
MNIRVLSSILFLASLGVFFASGSALAATPPTRPVPVHPEYARTSDVSLWTKGFASSTSFPTFEKTYLRGGYLASGDVNGDGKDEIIVGSGIGRINEVRVYSTDGKQLSSFQPYPTWFSGGVRVAVIDMNGDGNADIVTAPGPGIESRIEIFDAAGKKSVNEALAYPKTFLGGVHIASGDVNRDSKPDIIVAPGSGGGPHVRVFDANLQDENMDTFVFDAKMTDGVNIAVIHTPWGDQLVAGPESWSEPLVRRFSFDQNGGRLDQEFYAFASSSHSGVTLGAHDLDGDGNDEIVTAQNGGTVPEVRFYDAYGSLFAKAMLKDPPYRGALSFASVHAEKNAHPVLATMILAPTVYDLSGQEKRIEVNIAEQRLYAYEHGRIARTFLVSTGVARHPTPIVETKVLAKILSKRYKWTYSPGNPDNYDLPNVKWNLRVYGPVFIHGAYWHNNFGNRMSHGCINVDYGNAEWIYNWADVGVPVSIHQ